MLSRIKPITTEIASPLALKLANLGVKPNHLTLAGIFFAVVSAYLIVKLNILLASIFVTLSSLCDLLDGALARKAELTTKFGSYLDSVADRYVDVILFISLGIYGIDWLAISLAMSGALLVSYTRARAENLIEKCDVGIAERSERLLILLFGMVSGYIYEAVILIAILSHITAAHRIVFTYLKLKK